LHKKGTNSKPDSLGHGTVKKIKKKWISGGLDPYGDYLKQRGLIERATPDAK
jgi:hypothetical protein